MEGTSRLAAGLALIAGMLASSCTAPMQRFEVSRPKMGTSFRMVLYATSAERAERAIDAAYARLDELNEILSDYDPESELSRASAKSDDAPGAPMQVSAELATVLGAALIWAEASGGAFDPTLGPLVRLWRRSSRQGELPSAERLAEARARVGWRALGVDEAARRVTLEKRSMRLDLGGIAKGYALDECVRLFAQHGIRRVLVDGGGDVVAGQAPPGERGWRVQVDPFGEGARALTLELEHEAVATSGDAYRYVEIDGRRYSHVLDPQTGLGCVHRAAATVVARDGMTADALATAACVLGGARGVELLVGVDGVEGRVLELEGDGLRAYATPGFAPDPGE